MNASAERGDQYEKQASFWQYTVFKLLQYNREQVAPIYIKA